MEKTDARKLSTESQQQLRNQAIRLRKAGRKYKEIAEKLGISIKTVEAQMSKALKYLRLHLSDYLSMLLIITVDIIIKILNGE